MKRIVGLLLVVLFALSGAQVAAAHAARHARVDDSHHAMAAMHPDCHDTAPAHPPRGVPDDSGCSILCSAIAPLLQRVEVVRVSARVALADAAASFESLGRAPPAPPPRG